MTESHDDHHGHIQLQYQPALPIPNGKVCLWLFLSTEIMFFAGLIGTYIVLRFGAPTGTWPLPHDVHVTEWIGALNTFILICSSVTIVLALEAAKKDKPAAARNWLALTLVLGTAFLGWKAYEYQSKFSHGIYPGKPHSLLYERADIYYLSAVRQRLNELQSHYDGIRAAGERDLTEEEAARLELVADLRKNMVQWTEKAVAKSDNAIERQRMMQNLAYHVYPLHRYEGMLGIHHDEEGHAHGAYWDDEKKALTKQQGELKSQLAQKESQLKGLGDSAEDQALKASLNKEIPALESQVAAVEGRLELTKTLPCHVPK